MTKMTVVLLGLSVARSRGPCGCRPVFQFCANDYTTYHSICEYKCKHPSSPFQDWYILYQGPCHSEPDTTTKRFYNAYATTEEPTTKAYDLTTTAYDWTTTSYESTVIEWIPTSLGNAASLSGRAVVAGDDSDGSPLWVIRAQMNGDLLPGKYAAKRRQAYVPWGGYEIVLERFEVCCALPERIRWVSSRDNVVPPTAVVAGHTAAGDPLYVGRTKHKDSTTPGKVNPSEKILYISYMHKEIIVHNTYEIMCTI